MDNLTIGFYVPPNAIDGDTAKIVPQLGCNYPAFIQDQGEYKQVGSVCVVKNSEVTASDANLLRVAGVKTLCIEIGDVTILCAVNFEKTLQKKAE